MIGHKIFTAEKIVELEAEGPIGVEDLQSLEKLVRQEVSQCHVPNGVVILVPHFPEWKSLDALIAHLEFVRENNVFLKRVAIVSDDPDVRSFVEKCIARLVRPAICFFPSNAQDQARDWAASHANC